MKLKSMKIVKGQSGIITLDFAFAIVIAFSFTSIFMVTAFTLAMVEVGQYVTYSTSRAYNGAHESPQLQRDLAIAKYTELTKSGFIKGLLDSKWIELGPPDLRDFAADGTYSDPGADEIFVGARIRFKSNVLNIRLPFLGGTADRTNTGVAYLNSFLMREVSTQECREQFNALRYEKIKQLNEKYQSLPGTQALITDNGC